MNRLRHLALILFAAGLSFYSAALPLNAAQPDGTQETEDFRAGKALYMKKCEVCHLIGRNLINPEKEISKSKLLDDSEKLKEFLKTSHGAMPAFPKIAGDSKKVKQLIDYLHHAKANPSDIEHVKPQAGSAASKEKGQAKTKESSDKASNGGSKK